MLNYDSAIAAAEISYPSVPDAWIRAFIGRETSYNTPPVTWEPKVQAYSYGPMQILLSTAQGLGFNVSAADLQDPATNILIGTAYIDQLIQQNGLDFAAVTSAYVSGSATAYQTSAQVAADVAAGIDWLQQFGGSLSAAAASSSPAVWIAAAGLGLLWWHHRRRRAA